MTYPYNQPTPEEIKQSQEKLQQKIDARIEEIESSTGYKVHYNSFELSEVQFLSALDKLAVLAEDVEIKNNASGVVYISDAFCKMDSDGEVCIKWNAPLDKIRTHLLKQPKR